MSFQGQNRLGGGGGGGALNTLKGDSGGFVGPDGGGNINIIGDGATIDVAGNPGTNTLTISATGTVALFFTADDTNVASPIGGNLNIFGSTNINTEAPGSADTIQVNLNDSILLPATTDQDHGVIALGVDLTTDRFIHNFGTDSTFIGNQSGNFTNTGNLNTGLGKNTLTLLTSGIGNTAIGAVSLSALTTGSFNSAIGTSSLVNVTTGSRNVCITGGGLYTTESDNVLLGNGGVVADAHTIRIGRQGTGVFQQNATYIAGIYNTAFGATNQIVSIDDQGKLGSSKGNDGQILIGSSAGSPLWANITSTDLTVTVTNGANTIDLSTSGGAAFTVTTNDATPTALISHTVAANSAVTMNATVSAAKSDFSESLWGTVVFGARRVGGGAIAVESATTSFNDDSVGAPIITADVSGNNLRLMVTGVAALTWNWKAVATFVTQT